MKKFRVSSRALFLLLFLILVINARALASEQAELNFSIENQRWEIEEEGRFRFNLKEEEIIEQEEKGIEDKEEQGWHMLKIAYSSILISGEANHKSWFLEDGSLLDEGAAENLVVDYSDYDDLSEGRIYNIGLRFLGGNSEMSRDTYKINEQIDGISFDGFEMREKSILTDNLKAYGGLGIGGSRFRLNLVENRIIKELTGDEVDYLKRYFLNLRALLGLRLELKGINLLADFNFKRLISLSSWYYRQDDQLLNPRVSIEEQYLPYSDFSLASPIFRLGIGKSF